MRPVSMILLGVMAVGLPGACTRPRDSPVEVDGGARDAGASGTDGAAGTGPLGADGAGGARDATTAEGGPPPPADGGSDAGPIDGAPPDALPADGPVMNVVSVAGGRGHTCALVAGGQVLCWGTNFNGQLGRGAPAEGRFPPAPVEGLPPALAVATGTAHSCALLADRTVRCWGWNVVGQVGAGTTPAQPQPVAVPGLNGVTALAAGAAFTCALSMDGLVRCWGDNTDGQLAVDPSTSTSSATPQTVPGVAGAGALAAGSYHACAAVGGGRVLCWGSNSGGQLGDDGLNAADTLHSATPVEAAGVAGATKLVAGAQHTCALLASGSVRCWGSNNAARLEDANGPQDAKPFAPLPLAGVMDLAAGEDHTCALVGGGNLQCWGRNGAGQLGDGDAMDAVAPVAAHVTGVMGVGAGLNHTCAIRAGGTLSCWGGNADGQLGGGDPPLSLDPVSVAR